MRKKRDKEKLVQDLVKSIAFIEFEKDEKIISSIRNFAHLMSNKIVVISHSEDNRDCQKKNNRQK